MSETRDFVERTRERQRLLVQDMIDIEAKWMPGKTERDHPPAMTSTVEFAQVTLGRLKVVSEEIGEVFLKAPVTALNDPTFAWASYEIANARLNLTHLLLFGQNAVALKAMKIPSPHYFPEVQS